MDITENKGEGQLHAAQVELSGRWQERPGASTSPTPTPTPTPTSPDSGNSTIGVILYNPYDLEADRGPDPNVVKHRVVANATWDIPVGKGRKYGSSMPGWADALFGGWTVSTIFQARSGLNLTPFFTGYYSYNPWNTAQVRSDGLGNVLRLRLAARTRSGTRTPAARATSGSTRRPTPCPAAGRVRQRQEGQPRRARAPGS